MDTREAINISIYYVSTNLQYSLESSRDDECELVKV